MNHSAETGVKPIKSQENSEENEKIQDVQKNKRVRKLIEKENPKPKRKYNKKNNQIHIHSICFAVKEGQTLRVDQIETQLVDESRSIKKISAIELGNIIERRDSEKLKKMHKEKQAEKFECQYQSAQEVTPLSHWSWGAVKNPQYPGGYPMEMVDRQNYVNWTIQPYITNYPAYIGSTNWMNAIR